MKTLCFGSINIDHQYTVERFVSPGETLACLSYEVQAGGKGLNQSIALSRAGAAVMHAGSIHAQDTWLLELFAENQVHTQHIALSHTPTGHAIIQINAEGENCILLNGGANQAISKEQIDSALQTKAAGSWLLLQNEINNQPYIIQKAQELGLKIAINPAPMNASISELPLGELDLLILNETEIQELSGLSDTSEALRVIRNKYAKPLIILTKGSHGSTAISADGQVYEQAAIEANEVVDTTAAGDCYIGYFISSYTTGKSIEHSMQRAAQAAAITVSRKGAALSIPFAAELDD